jgi:hypothetical protein
MRRYDIVSGILLVLPFVDFALAAPVLVQEKQRQDVITVFGKRSGLGETYDEIDKAVKEYFENFGNPFEATGVHATSSSSRPLAGPDHGILQAPPQNSPASEADLYPWKEPSSPSALSESSGSIATSFPPPRLIFTPDEQGIANLPEQHGTSDAISDNAGSNKGDYMLQYSPTSSGYDSDRAFFDANPPPQPNHALPTTDSGSETDSDSESNFNWNYWMNPEHFPTPRPVSATEPGHEGVTPPSTDPESRSLGTDSQPEDPQAETYATRGIAKVSGTVRDVRNLA